jgi:hypothetical protein
VVYFVQKKFFWLGKGADMSPKAKRVLRWIAYWIWLVLILASGYAALGLTFQKPPNLLMVVPLIVMIALAGTLYLIRPK